MPRRQADQPSLPQPKDTVADAIARDPLLSALDAHPWREREGRTYLYVRPPHTLYAVRAVLFDGEGRPYLDRPLACSKAWIEGTTPAEAPEGLDSPK